jgi:thioredoxin 1
VERLSEDAFDGDRLRRAGRYLVCFTASWCPFCRAFEPRFSARGSRLGAMGAFADVDDEESPLWERFHLDVIPTLVAFEDGATVGRIDGVLGRGLDDRALDRAPALFGAAAR